MENKKFGEGLKNLPPLSQYREQLKILRERNMTTYSPSDIRKVFYEYAQVLPFSYSPIPVESINLLKVYRYVTISESTVEPQFPSRFSYPPNDKCIENGRANLKGFPVFYSAEDPISTFLESLPDADKVMYIGEWGFKCDRNVNIRPMLPHNLIEINPWNQFVKNHWQSLFETFGRLCEDKRQHLFELFSLLAELFRFEKAPYPITSWISHETFYKYDTVDAMVYPCVKSHGLRSNMVFARSFIDDYGLLLNVAKVKFLDVGKITLRYRPLLIGRNLSGTINWEEPNATNTSWLPGSL